MGARSRQVLLLSMLTLPLAVGCASSVAPDVARPAFDFHRDILAYTNNNYWIYHLGPRSGAPIVKERRKHIDHGQRCTIMARVVRQFLYGARFEPQAAKASDAEYRTLVREVLASDPRRESPLDPPVTIPGYPDLRSLSLEHEALLKEELGGRWLGYRQRGNWRMIFAFSPGQQRATAEGLVEDLDRGHLPLVHILNFPRIDINHTLLVFAFEETPVELRFDAYDPNNAKEPVSLVFDRASATFLYARTDYFPGGPAKVYEVYDGLLF